MTAAEIIRIDIEKGMIQVAYIDANDSGWPESTEESGCFNWEEVFYF